MGDVNFYAGCRSKYPSTSNTMSSGMSSSGGGVALTADFRTNLPASAANVVRRLNGMLGCRWVTVIVVVMVVQDIVVQGGRCSQTNKMRQGNIEQRRQQLQFGG